MHDNKYFHVYLMVKCYVLVCYSQYVLEVKKIVSPYV